MQQEVRADLHGRKHCRLHDLAGHRSVQVLPGPFQLCPVLLGGVCMAALPLGIVGQHRICQNAVVLEPLGREHGQGPHQFVVAALDACPLHGGVIGLGLLDHSLIGLVHSFPVGFAAFRGCTLCKLIGMVLHIPLGAFPQGRHRDLVHAVDPARQLLGDLLHSLLRRTQVLPDAFQLAPLTAPQAVLQQRIPVFSDLCFQRCPLLG